MLPAFWAEIFRTARRHRTLYKQQVFPVKILAGDIGGTHTRLALFEVESGRLHCLYEAVYPSAEHASLDAIVERFLESAGMACRLACFGLAGPVRNRRCKTTNLPWLVDAETMEKASGLARVWLINDLEATAWGIAGLGADDFHTLQKGDHKARGNRCVIAAGTGLGEAGLYWDGSRYRPFATEGGHADFAPRNALEFALLEYLGQRFGHVSWERLVSGPGLVAIYRFLKDYRKQAEPDWLTGALRQGDAAAVISSAALERRCPVCAEALDLFVEFYGAEAGNLALKHMATGGVYIGGGIAPKILPKLKEGGFLRAFNAKGRMEPLLQAMPVHVIVNDRAALYGPGLYAMARRETAA